MKNKIIVFFFVMSFLSANAMTEYERMYTKQQYTQNLRASVHDEAAFKKQFNDYAAFLKQAKEKDSYIANVLEQHFKQVMQQDRLKLDKAQNDLKDWQESIKNEYFLKNMDKGSVLAGIASCGLSAAAGYLLFYIFSRESRLDDGDGVMGGFLGTIVLFAGIAGPLMIQEGWNYNKDRTKALQDELAAIKEGIKNSNANYAYMANNKEKFL